MEVAERLIRESPSDAAARANWASQRGRLSLWRHDVEEARNLYKHERPEPLRGLYDYWRLIAPDDLADQVRFASETYHEFRFECGQRA